MLLSSRLPLGSLFFKHWHTDDTEIGVVVAKAVFEVRDDGTLKTIKPAPDLVLADVFGGDLLDSSSVEEDKAEAEANNNIRRARDVEMATGSGRQRRLRYYDEIEEEKEEISAIAEEHTETSRGDAEEMAKQGSLPSLA